MANVIDALFVTLGLDAREYIGASSKVEKSQIGLEKTILASGKKIDAAQKKSDAEATRNAKAHEARAKSIALGFNKIRNEAVTMLAVFTGGVGLTRFFTSTVTGAANMGRLSQNLSMATERIGAYQQASERAGGSADGILAQLMESQQAVANFKIGKGASEGMAEFFRLGGDSKSLQTGNEFLLARADIVKQLYDRDPGEGVRAAAAMGISDDQFNLIKQGSTAILQLVADREKYAKFSGKDAQAADALRIKMLDLKDSFALAGTKLALQLAPALETAMTWFGKLADWINENRSKIGDWAERSLAKVLPMIENFVAAVRDADWQGLGERFEKVGAAIVTIADALTNAKAAWDKWAGREEKPTANVSKSWFGMRFGKADDLDKDDRANGRTPPARVVDNRSDAQKLGFGGRTEDLATLAARKAHIVAEAQKNGYTAAQGAGMVGSLMQENSTMNPSLKNSIGATGIAQWLSKDRKAHFKKQFGKDIGDGTFEEQVKFMFEELRTTEARAGKALRGARTPEEAAKIHSDMYERPGAHEANVARRQANARAVADGAARGAVSPQASLSSNTSTTETRIDSITINTAATDAAGIARDMRAAIAKQSLASQSNSGLA